MADTTTPSWMTQIFGDGTNGGIFGGGSGGGSNALTAAGLIAAGKQFTDANSYGDVAKQAADISNPFGDRSQYKNMLSQSYADPNAVLNDPAHQILLHRGLDDVASNNAAKGYMGSGNMLQDLSKYASDSNATYLDQERKTLGNLAGAQFDPANASKMIMEGNNQKINAQNNAIAALLAPFMAQLGQNKIDQTTSPPIGKNPLTGQPWSKGTEPPPGVDPVQWAKMLGFFKINGDNTTTQPGTGTVGGGINGGDGNQPGPGGDAPGSGGDQYPWPESPSDPMGPQLPAPPDNEYYSPGGYTDPGDNWDSWLQGISDN